MGMKKNEKYGFPKSYVYSKRWISLLKSKLA